MPDFCNWLYLQKEAHVCGLVHLLTLALSMLVLMEHTARRTLAQREETLVGLYPYQPKRATHRPTAEALIGAFAGLDYDYPASAGESLPISEARVTRLSRLQQQILQLLGLPEDTYQRLARAGRRVGVT